ncbi:MAG: fibronectin type III domain-containing protein [candidate division Zixibacteria bacterium]|nr:fibronectin type III domain-containing protein [candidate division Zixibacteria bacterium]
MMTRYGCYILVLVMITLVVCSGCDRWPSNDPELPAPEAPPAPINLVAHINDRSLDLSWEVSDSSNVGSFRIYRADSDGADFYLFDSVSDYVKTVSGLTFGQPLRFQVTAVSSVGIEGLPSDEITAIAGLLSLILDGGNEYTNDRDVSILLSVPGNAIYLELSEDPSFADALVQSFTASTMFELSEGDKLKTVYARMTFADGFVSDGTVSDDIELDTEATIDSVTFSPTGQVLMAGDTISFFLDAHGELEGTATVSIPRTPNIDLYDDGTTPDVTADDGLYSAYYVVPSALNIFDGEVDGDFQDIAGNVAPTVSAVEPLNVGVSTPPEAVTLAGGLIDTATVRLTWTQSDDDDFASYRICRSDLQGTIITDVDSLRIAIVNQQNTLNYDDYLTSTGTYYYRIFVFDTQGEFAGSNEVAVTR